LLPAAACSRQGRTATRARYVRRSMPPRYRPRSRAGLRDEYRRGSLLFWLPLHRPHPEIAVAAGHVPRKVPAQY
jgi:hypothetical protein